MDKCFEAHGALRLCEVGEGDDGSEKTTEEELLAWKETLWKSMCAEIRLEEHEALYEPSFDIQEQSIVTNATLVYLREPNPAHLSGNH